MVHRRALLLAASLGLLAPRASEAQELSASELALAKDLLRDATIEQKKGNCGDAIDLLQQALAIKETAEATMRLGECQASVGALVEGLASLEKADTLARGSRDTATQRALAKKTPALRARVPLLSLDLPADVKDPQVSLDGEPISAEKAAQPLAVNPGEHTVDASAEGRRPFTRTLTLAEKARITVQVLLPKPEEPRVEPPPSPPEPDRSRPIPAATWIGGSAAVLLGAGGAVAYVIAGEMAADGEAECASRIACDPATMDTVRRLDAAALGMWIGAGIGAGVAITFLVLSQSGEPEPTASIGLGAPRLVVGPGSLHLAGSF